MRPKPPTRITRLEFEKRKHSPFYPRPDFPIARWREALDPLAWKHQFERAARDPREWQDQGRGHAAAANALVWVTMTTPNLLHHSYVGMKTILFLYGAAVENLIKALWIARGNDPLSGEGLDRRLKTHNLRHLAVQADFVIVENDKSLLEWLQNIIESAKYPISRSAARRLEVGMGAHLKVPRILALLKELEHELVLAAPPPRTHLPVDFTTLGIPIGQTVLIPLDKPGYWRR